VGFFNTRCNSRLLLRQHNLPPEFVKIYLHLGFSGRLAIPVFGRFINCKFAALDNIIIYFFFQLNFGLFEKLVLFVIAIFNALEQEIYLVLLRVRRLKVFCNFTSLNGH